VGELVFTIISKIKKAIKLGLHSNHRF
jgi:hypothetical protein